MTTKPFEPSAPWRQLATHRELLAPRDDLGIQVSVSCCYCHDGLQRTAAAFCATCLAPHHVECFETHARCATLACGGTEVILPTALRKRLSPARRLGGGLVLVALTIGGTVAALSANDVPFVATDETTVEAAAFTRPIPSSVYVGSPKSSVLREVGIADRDESDGDGSVVSWYGQGARAEFDAEDRLTKASFFGIPESDGAVDANGNKPIFDRNTGWYRPQPWRWRGVAMGMPGPAVIDHIGEADVSIPDANGNMFLHYTQGNAIIQLTGDRMLYEVVAIHFGGSVGVDANGNGSVEPADLTTEFSAQTALAKALTEADRAGDLDAVLGEQAYVRYDTDGRVDTLYRVSGSRLPDLAGVDLKFDILTVGGGGRREEHVRLSFDGRVTAYSNRWIMDGKVVTDLKGKESTRGRLEVRVIEKFTPSYQRVILCDDETLPHDVVIFVLSRLGSHVAPAPWRVRYNDPLAEYGKGVLMAKAPDIDHWKGEFVRTLATEPRGGSVPTLLLRVGTTDRGIRRANYGDFEATSASWLEPISKARFTQLVVESRGESGLAPLDPPFAEPNAKGRRR